MFAVTSQALKPCSFGFLSVSDDTAPELALRPKFLSTSGTAMDQAGKLGLGANKSTISVFKNYQVWGQLRNTAIYCHVPQH